MARFVMAYHEMSCNIYTLRIRLLAPNLQLKLGAASANHATLLLTLVKELR